MKNRERYRYHTFFVLMITLMLSRVFSETLMYISNKHNHKTFTKSPPASLFTLHRKHFQLVIWEVPNSLSSMTALSFTNWPLYKIYLLILP